MPEPCCRHRPRKCRGRREGRAPAGTRGPLCDACAKQAAQRHTGEAGTARPSLRSGLTAYVALSPGSDALLPPSPCGWLTLPPGRAGHVTARLGASLRAPRPHDFAVRRLHRSCARRRSLTGQPALQCPSRQCGPRPPRPTPRSRRSRCAPRPGVGWTRYTIIRNADKENYLQLVALTTCWVCRCPGCARS